MADTLDVPVLMELMVDGDKIFGRATLEGRMEPIGAEAQALRHADGSIDAWAYDLVTARLLRKLEIELMERVHERIDRSVVNDV